MVTEALAKHFSSTRSAVVVKQKLLSRIGKQKILALRTHTHTRTHASSLTIQKEAERLRTGALPAAAGLRLPPKAASLTQRGFLALFVFKFSFKDARNQFTPSGAAPPRPKGERGLLWMLLRSSSCRLLRSLRGNGWKPAPNVGGVGHSCDLPLGHSCDLPLVAYRPQKRFT